MFKKITAMLLTFLLFLFLAGCADENTLSESVPQTVSNQSDETEKDTNSDAGSIPEEEGETIFASKLEGTVYTKDRVAIPNLKIRVEGVGEFVTDENGKFELALAAGKYKIFAISRDGTETELREVNLGENSILRMKLMYNPAGNLEGTLYYSDYSVAKGVKLKLQDVGEVVTDKNGKFRFANVPAGTYALYAIQDNTKIKLRNVNIDENTTLTIKVIYDPHKESYLPF